MGFLVAAQNCTLSVLFIAPPSANTYIIKRANSPKILGSPSFGRWVGDGVVVMCRAETYLPSLRLAILARFMVAE